MKKIDTNSPRELEIQALVQHEQGSGNSHYDTARKVETMFGTTWNAAYHRTRKYWNPPALGKPFKVVDPTVSMDEVSEQQKSRRR